MAPRKKTKALLPHATNGQSSKKTAAKPAVKKAAPKKRALRAKQDVDVARMPPPAEPTTATVPGGLTLADAARMVSAAHALPGLAEEDQHLVQDATGWSLKYTKIQQVVMAKLVQCLRRVPDLAFLADEVDVSGHPTMNLVSLISGKKTPDKLAIVNKAMLCFAVGLKHSSGKLYGTCAILKISFSINS
jgi:hypothetical protein